MKRNLKRKAGAGRLGECVNYDMKLLGLQLLFYLFYFSFIAKQIIIAFQNITIKNITINKRLFANVSEGASL